MSLCETFVFGVSGGIEYSLYKDSDWAGVEEVLYTYYQGEMSAIGTEINLPESELGRAELNGLCVDALRDGISVIARDIQTNKIVGHAINKLLYLSDDPDEPSYYAKFRDTCTSPNAWAYINFMVIMDALVNVFAYLKTNCTFDYMFLATLPEYKGRGIGTQMSQYSLEFACQLSNGENLACVSDAVRRDPRRPTAMTAIATSAFTQRIGYRLGMEKLASIGYDELVFQGRTFADRIQDNRQTHAEQFALKLNRSICFA